MKESPSQVKGRPTKTSGLVVSRSKPDAERGTDEFAASDQESRLSTQVYTPFGRWAACARIFSKIPQVRSRVVRKVVLSNLQ
jgi:hypothetical protein